MMVHHLSEKHRETLPFLWCALKKAAEDPAGELSVGADMKRRAGKSSDSFKLRCCSVRLYSQVVGVKS